MMIIMLFAAKQQVWQQIIVWIPFYSRSSIEQEETLKNKQTVCMLALALALMLGACAKAPADQTETPAPEPKITAELPAPAAEEPQAAPVETEESAPTPAPAPDRQDGERFEKVIVILGLEETAHCEHIINESLGFAMDYDYERFERYSEADRERFVSVWDKPGNPENYLEVTCSDEDAETVAAAVSQELSRDYDITRDTGMLDYAGECIRIHAEVIKGSCNMAEHLQTVYIVPAPDGCRIVRAHSYITESEAFGKLFSYMVKSLSVIDRG